MNASCLLIVVPRRNPTVYTIYNVGKMDSRIRQSNLKNTFKIFKKVFISDTYI